MLLLRAVGVSICLSVAFCLFVTVDLCIAVVSLLLTLGVLWVLLATCWCFDFTCGVGWLFCFDS